MIISNTMTGEKEALRPLHGGRINIFVCGPTVYDDAHIGHARTYIAFDVVARYLKARGYSVFYLQNITDIDDKIIDRAKKLEVDPAALARKFERRYLEDMKALGVENVNLYARATEHIPEIISQIERLMARGFAYETESGVYFDESKFEEFGKLSHKGMEDPDRHRIEPDPTKRNRGDFTLWKKRSGEEGISWQSPWGEGRPGWHIEDTAITETYFGPQYDIHGGAIDLIFPHHEAEIAQMEAVSGKAPMVSCWMHTGFLNVKGEKMSKSLGNFITIRELLKTWEPDVFRLAVLSAHYRTPIDFSESVLDQSRRSLERIRKLVSAIDTRLEAEGDDLPSPKEDEALERARTEFFEAMDDDFNTPNALRAVFGLVRDLNRRMDEGYLSTEGLRAAGEMLAEFGEILGLNLSAEGSREEDDKLMDGLLALLREVRQRLREKREWELADEIRGRLLDLGIVLEDKNQGANRERDRG